MARLSVKDAEGPDPRELKERKRRQTRAYADGGFTDAEYQVKCAEIDASMQLTESVNVPTCTGRSRPFVWRHTPNLEGGDA